MHAHSPRDVEDVEGNLLRTVCGECGATLEVEILPEVSVENVDDLAALLGVDLDAIADIDEMAAEIAEDQS